MATDIQRNLKDVEQRIAEAAGRAGRSAGDVELIVVSKNRSLEEIRKVLECGAYTFGENRVQEALGKMPELPADAAWHLIGHLQRNKAKQVVGRFAMIHSLDSRRLAEALQRAAEKEDYTVEALLEINVSGEDTKFGLGPNEVEPLLVDIAQSFDRIHVVGLMTMAPYVAEPEETRPVFSALRDLRDRLAEAAFALPHLSMGMTNDYEVAVEEGATMVRVGTAIFGPRSRG